MKLLVTGDLHFRGTNPRGRIDNFQEAITDKLLEVFELGMKHKANGIIIPGDIFDSPHTSIPVLTDLARLLRIYTHPPIMTVAGNHDIIGGNQGTIPRTPYGLLEGLDMIWDLQRYPWDTRDATGVVITGHGYDTETDREVSQYLLPTLVADKTDADEDSGDTGTGTPVVRIHVAHGMLLDRRPPFEMRHTLVSEVVAQERADKIPDVLVCGHMHSGFGVLTLEKPNGGNMVVVNPGALCRLSTHPEEMERTVQVCLLEINTKAPRRQDRVKTKMIPLDSARPGHEVLSREHLEVRAERESRIAEFLGLLAQEGEGRFLETREIVEDIGRRENLPKAVVKEALRRLEEARNKTVA